MEVENGGEDSPDEESEDDDDKPLKPKVQAKPSPVPTGLFAKCTNENRYCVLSLNICIGHLSMGVQVQQTNFLSCV